MTPEIFDAVCNTNFRGYYFGCQSAAQNMLLRGEGGVIINIGSVNAITVVPGQAVYAATKAAISQMTKLFAREWGRDHIRVNCVAPGVILTDMCANVAPDILAGMAEETPLGRNGMPMDVAKAIAYLADAEFVTGQVLGVSGGYVI